MPLFLILKQYLNYALYAIIAGLVIALTVQSYRINSFKADIAKSRAQIMVLSTSLQMQNNAVSELAANGVKRKLEADKAIKAAVARALLRKDKITALTATISNTDTCEQAVIAVKDSL